MSLRTYQQYIDRLWGTHQSKIRKKSAICGSRNCSDKYYLKVKNQRFFSHWSGATSSITILARERELVSQSQLFFPSCLSQPIRQWPVQEAWKEKLGLRYKLSFSTQFPKCNFNIFLYSCFQLLRYVVLSSASFSGTLFQILEHYMKNQIPPYNEGNPASATEISQSLATFDYHHIDFQRFKANKNHNTWIHRHWIRALD